MIDDLNLASDGKYDFVANVILEKGDAKYVVIEDLNDGFGNTGVGPGTNDPDVDVTVNLDARKINVVLNEDITVSQQRSAISKALAVYGYVVTEWNPNGVMMKVKVREGGKTENAELTFDISRNDNGHRVNAD